MLLRALGHRVRIDCTDPELNRTLHDHFIALSTDDVDARAAIAFTIGVDPLGGLSLDGPDGRVALADDAEALYGLESALVVALQRARPDLLFLHAAVLERDGRAFLLAGESGAGKSTTAWALLHHGFAYASDELAPIDPATLQVLPYPRALCLKHAPAAPYALPASVRRSGGTIYLAPARLPSRVVEGPRPIDAVFVLEARVRRGAPVLRPIGAAEAGARLYVTALNALSHAERGLAAVLRIARHARCHALAPGELAATCAAIERALDSDASSGAGHERSAPFLIPEDTQ